MSYVERAYPKSGNSATAIDPYLFLVYDSSGNLAVNTTAQGSIVGVSAEGVDAANRAIPFWPLGGGGKVKVKCAASVTAGGKVASDANGKAIAWVDAVGNNAVGIFVTDGANNDIVTIELFAADVGGGS